MLVLTRVRNERIMIGEDIVLTVVDVNRKTGHVRLGFTAPKSVAIHREEVHMRIKDAQTDAIKRTRD